MTSVAFKQHLTVTGDQDMTIERVFRALAEYAGLHSFKFDELAEDWDTSGAEGTWTASPLQGVGTSGNGWQFMLSTGDMPKAFVSTITSSSTRAAVCVLATDVDNLIYLSWTSTAVSIVSRESDEDTVLCSLPKAFADTRQVMVSVQPGDDDDCFISMWFDGVFVVNAHLDTYPAGRKFGLGVYDSDTANWSSWTVPELTEVLPVVTMDVGETPLGALQRAIGRRHINYFVRWNGALRAWRPKTQTAAATFDDGKIYVRNQAIDRRGLFSHWRQVGAWDYADAFDTTLLAAIGHRFHKDDNPDLMTVEDCQNEAEYSLTRGREYAHTGEVEIPFLAFLEPEDRVTIDTDEWLVTSFEVAINAGALIQRVGLREYVYE